MPAIKALFFDFDGLILDTESAEVESWRQIFAGYGEHFPDWIWQKMIGISDPEINKIPGHYLAERLGVTQIEEFDTEVRQKRRALTLEIIETYPVMPGVTELLSHAVLNGWHKAVVSSSPRWWVEGHLEKRGLKDHFHHITCGHEGHPSKPAPDLYLATLEKLSLLPNEVIVFEDSPRGVEAALAAGLQVYVVPNPLTAQLEFPNGGKRVQDLSEALTYLG